MNEIKTLTINGITYTIKGQPGDTPVKGVDYYTQEDKAEMVADVLAALPTYDGEVEEV